jgi:anti-sigma regulatory factor (Ser/Thr protein kinase)
MHYHGWPETYREVPRGWDGVHTTCRMQEDEGLRRPDGDEAMDHRNTTRARSGSGPPTGTEEADPLLGTLAAGPEDTSERDRLLASTASRVIAQLHASAVTVYLYEPQARVLAAVVVSVTPLGTGSVERVRVDDNVYASSVAFRTGKMATAHSIEELGSHPELAVLAPWPFTVTSLPLLSPTRRFGALAVYWPQMSHRLSPAERRHLVEAGARTSRELDRLADRGVSMAPPSVPYVITPPPGTWTSLPGIASGGTDDAERQRDARTTPLIYHLHKLANALISAESTQEAVDLALERVTNGFNCDAMAITLIEGDRLRVVGAVGCSREFVRQLNGQPLGRQSSLESEAVTQKRQIIKGLPASGSPGAAVIEPSTAAERLSRDAEAADGNQPAPDSAAGVPASHAWAVLPLLAGGHALGSCSIGFRPGQAVAITEHPVLIALATLLGQTLERTRLYDAQQALAQKLQQTLLPRRLPQLAGVVTTARYLPSSGGIELGGDWYDLISLPDHRIGAVIGDVQGHNISAAVVMGQLRSAVRAYAAEGHDPGTVLSRANRLLVELDTDLFATCLCLWLDPSTGQVEIVTAGHYPPIVRTPDGDDHGHQITAGIPLGIEPDARYETTRLTLAPGTLIALYTDGLVNADQQGHPVQDALEAALANAGDLETLGDRMIARLTDRPARTDDAALLLMRFEGASAEAQLHVERFAVHRRDLPGVRRARRFVRDWLHSVELAPMSEEVELLASEVVTNALVHGDSDVDIHMRRYPERIRIEVRDSDPHLALPIGLAPDDDEAEGGRGLAIVSSIASAWGNSPSGRGKTVWFELQTPKAHDMET